LKEESVSSEFYKSPERIKIVLARIDAVELELETCLARWVELDSRGAPK
jgi:hypothetical protein